MKKINNDQKITPWRRYLEIADRKLKEKQSLGKSPLCPTHIRA
jgi:hypothetical protein